MPKFKRANISLRRYLAASIFALVAIPLMAVSGFAYWRVYSLIKTNAIQNVAQVSAERHAQLAFRLTRSIERAQGLLAVLDAQCPTSNLAACAADRLAGYGASESALGVSMFRGTNKVASFGDMGEFSAGVVAFKAGQLAHFAKRLPGDLPSYAIDAQLPGSDVHLVVHYPVSTIQTVYTTHPALGHSGETFLADANGFLITSARYQSSQGHGNEPISAEPMKACLATGDGEMLATDYRGTRVVHGFRAIPEIGGGCNMAHMDQTEAFAELLALRNNAAMLALLALALVFAASVALARRIAAPIEHMTRRIQGEAPSPGSSDETWDRYAEIRDMSRAFSQMQSGLEKAHADAEALLTTLNLHAIVSMADSGGRIIEVNDAFCSISGYTREELIGQDHRIVNSGEQSAAFWVDMWKTISSGFPWRGQVCNLSKSGERYWVDTFIAPYIGADGKIEKYVSIRTDITATKNAEAQLRWSQSLMDKMSNSSPLGFLVVDNRTDEILYFNQRFCDIWGIAHLAERMRSKVLKNKDIIPDCLPVLADVPAFAESCKPLQSESNRITLEDEIAFTNNRTVRRFTTQIRDADDQYFGRFYIFEDVSERKLAEQALINATEVARNASLSKSQFLANMSHELRTPMNAILGMLTLLRKTELTARQADYAAKSDGAARALLGLLNEILDFSKIEAGKMTLDPHPFAVDQLLRDLSTILSTSVGEKPIEVLFDIDPVLPRQLVADAMRLQQVLLNLASNAIKFTAQGEVVLSIQVMLCTDDVVTLQFSMRDSGIGIAPENQARIFSGFTQAESSTTRKYGGTGLGVAISQRFVAMMGGQLELQSEVGKGSRFYFTVTLPIAARVDEAERARLRAREQSASWRALVIDDNSAAREVLAHMGQSLGWQVDLAESGEQALALLLQRSGQGIHYEAIFVDWSMPDMDGWQTSQHIRALQAQAPDAADSDKTPVVVMVTSHGRELLSQRSAADQALLDGFLVKPVTASMLFDAVIDARAGHDRPHPSRGATQTVERRLEGMRLLLVEDNLNNQQVARELLEDEGATVQIANHGQEAVEAIAAATTGDPADAAFDVVLMDLQMPVMDGFAAARAIRNDLGLLTLPIVAMTANAMASDREACLAAGMNDHVGKPFDLNDLVRVLRQQAQRGDALPTPANKGLVLSAAVVQAASDAGVDLTTALNRLGGKQDVFRRMLQTFVKELQCMPDQLLALAQTHAQSHAQGATPNDAQRMLHSLKGLAATMGAGALATEATSAEKAMAGTPTPEQCLAASTQANDAIALALPGLQVLLAALEHDQVVAADSGAGKAALDRPALVAALGSLAALLQADDMEAMNALAELQQQFGAALGDGLSALEASMSELAFDLALPHCQALLEKYSGS